MAELTTERGTNESQEKCLYYDVWYSPDDGGHYAEIFNGNGRTVHVTDVVGDKAAARRAAQDWIQQEQCR